MAVTNVAVEDAIKRKACCPLKRVSEHTKCNAKYVSALVLYPGTVRPTLPGNEPSVFVHKSTMPSFLGTNWEMERA